MKEIKSQTETILETLPPTNNRPQIVGPHPLSAEVQAEQQVRGGNIHSIARDLGVKRSDPGALPPAVRTARLGVEKADQAKAKADAKLAEELAAWNRYKAALASIAEKRTEIANAESRLAQCHADVKSFPVEFQEWPKLERQRSWTAVCDRVNSTMIAERMIKPLEAWLEAARADLARMETGAGQLRDRYDFA